MAKRADAGGRSQQPLPAKWRGELRDRFRQSVVAAIATMFAPMRDERQNRVAQRLRDVTRERRHSRR